MGKIGFDGWKVVLDDIDKLNGSEEISRLGLNFKCHGEHMEEKRRKCCKLLGYIGRSEK